MSTFKACSLLCWLAAKSKDCATSFPWWFLVVVPFRGVASVSDQRFDVQLFLPLFVFIHDLRSCVDPLHASLCVVFQCILRPVYAGACIYKVVRQLMQSRGFCGAYIRCLHVLCSVGAAADLLPPLPYRLGSWSFARPAVCMCLHRGSH